MMVSQRVKLIRICFVLVRNVCEEYFFIAREKKYINLEY